MMAMYLRLFGSFLAGFFQIALPSFTTYASKKQCIDFIRDDLADKELFSLEDNEMNGHFIQGLIIGRRSMGRKLAFADIAITESAAHDDRTNIVDASTKIIFTRQSFAGPENNDDALKEPFPTTKPALPYGASICAQLGHCQKVRSNSSGVIEDVWEVIRWKVIEHPKELAENMASLISAQSEEDLQLSEQETRNKRVIIGRGAMSCSEYLKARREAFEAASKHRQRLLDLKTDICAQQSKDQTKDREIKPLTSTQHAERSIDNIESEFHHGGKQAKAKRAKIFASWILEAFFGIPMPTDLALGNVSIRQDRLICQPCQRNNNLADHIPQTHVFDIAGGKGQLSLELILQQMHSSTSVISRCTIVDPMVRKSDAKQRHAKLKKAASRIHKQNDNGVVGGTIEHIATCFSMERFPEIYTQSITNGNQEQNKSIPSTALLLGLHPDECSEAILDAALEHNLSVAIIPCCVFPYMFPSRKVNKRSSIGGDEKDEEEVPVREYNDFLQYLLDKDESLQLVTLPFEGKNKVIYRKVEAL
ncbi:hypothetical protein ACHAXM_001222 [Skeletonema potamos]